MLNVLSDLSKSFGDEEGEHIDLLMADSEEDSADDDGGAEFRPNKGLNLFRDFGLGDRSQLFKDRLFGLGVRLKSRLKLALNLILKKVEDSYLLQYLLIGDLGL